MSFFSLSPKSPIPDPEKLQQICEILAKYNVGHITIGDFHITRHRLEGPLAGPVPTAPAPVVISDEEATPEEIERLLFTMREEL